MQQPCYCHAIQHAVAHYSLISVFCFIGFLCLFFFFSFASFKDFLALSVNLRSEVGAVYASSREYHTPTQANLQLPAGSQPNPLMSPQPLAPAPPAPGLSKLLFSLKANDFDEV